MKGFTLSEVLITLVIVGVIAAMTIPGIIQSTQEQEYVTSLKKASSILNSAISMIKANEGISPDEWGLVPPRDMLLIDKLLPYLNYVKVCKSGENCHKNDVFTKSKLRMSNPFSDRPVVVLTDGMIIGGITTSPTNIKIAGNERKELAEFIVDVNGDRGPNRFGVDNFVFILTNDGIIPTGGNFIGPPTVWPYDFENGCLNSDSNGGGCTAWVLTHSNLDYLHCPDKIRAGKTSCKEK